MVFLSELVVVVVWLWLVMWEGMEGLMGGCQCSSASQGEIKCCSNKVSLWPLLVVVSLSGSHFLLRYDGCVKAPLMPQ